MLFNLQLRTRKLNWFPFEEKVLVQLNLTLVTKSDAYSDSSLRYIFRLNNSHYLLGALKRSGLLELLKVRPYTTWLIN